MSVTAWLQKIAAEQAPDHRRAALQLELDRLDRLQSAFWAMALALAIQVDGEVDLHTVN